MKMLDIMFCNMAFLFKNTKIKEVVLPFFSNRMSYFYLENVPQIPITYAHVHVHTPFVYHGYF